MDTDPEFRDVSMVMGSTGAVTSPSSPPLRRLGLQNVVRNDGTTDKVRIAVVPMVNEDFVGCGPSHLASFAARCCCHMDFHHWKHGYWAEPVQAPRWASGIPLGVHGVYLQASLLFTKRQELQRPA